MTATAAAAEPRNLQEERKMILKKGDPPYSKKELGVKFPYILFGWVDMGNEEYLFVNIGGRYRNKWLNGGIVHEPRSASEVVPSERPPAKTTHVFVRDLNAGEKKFNYEGELATVKRHDARRNFLTLK
jgi:hypothetical protein